MKAGRELDALVAEKVMETPKYWAVMFGGSHYGNFPSLELAQSRAIAIQGDYTASLHAYYDEPHYSTSIADAWQVFIKFTSRYVWFDDATDTWNCHLDPTRRTMEDCRYHAKSEDESGCEAICLAALKAVGVEVGS